MQGALLITSVLEDRTKQKRVKLQEVHSIMVRFWVEPDVNGRVFEDRHSSA